MPTKLYRLKAEAHPNTTLGYKMPTLDFSSDPKNAHQPLLTETDARNWLDHSWGHIKASWSNHRKWFAGHKIDDVRLVLEEVPADPKDAPVIVAVSVDWTNKSVVTSSSNP